jgi:hypothetical protein
VDTLAAFGDVAARYPGTLTGDQAARVPGLLADASTVVRSYTRQVFTASTTTEQIRPMGDRVRLRQAPVTAVTEVALVDTLTAGSLLILPMGAWMWDGGNEVWLGAITTVINLPDDITELLQYQTPLIQVAYSHGYPDGAMPDAVVTVVCSMVCRALDMPGPVSVASSTVGSLSYRLGTAAQDGILGLTASEMRMLTPFRRVATTAELR